MRKVILSIIFCVTAVIVRAYEPGELPSGSTAKSVTVDTSCTVNVGGKQVQCFYNPETQNWTPADIMNNPQAASCLDAAAAGIYNANAIASQYNQLLNDFNNAIQNINATLDAYQESIDALRQQLKDLDDDKDVDVNSCDLCDHETTFNSINVREDGTIQPGEISSQGCAITAKNLGNSIVSLGNYAAENRARLTKAEKRLTDAEATLEDHGGRITTLENANNDFATKKSVDALYLWGVDEHKRLLRKIGSVSEDLYAHINNGDGDGGDTNIIEFATCDLCSNTNGISMANLSFQPREEGSLGKPDIPAQIVSETTTVDGCEGAISQVEKNVDAVAEAVSTLLPLPPKLDEHIDWAKEDSAAQWDAIADNSLRKTTYTGSVKSLAEALDPNKEGQIGGQVMILAATSPTNYYAIDIGKMEFPECDGLSSNDVENLVNFLLESFNGGCACTPDEYIKEETDPVWEAEKAGYVTKDEFENIREALMAAMDQLRLEIEAVKEELKGDIAIVQNEVETVITATRYFDERITALESLTNNATGGN